MIARLREDAMALFISVGIVLISIIAAIPLLFTFVMAWRLVHPLRKPLESHPRLLDMPHEDVTINSPAGKLAAWFLPGTNGRTLIGLHGINDNREQWLIPARDLQARGYASLLFDFRGHGQSQGRHVTFGDRETEDVAAALEYLQQRGDIDMNRVGLMGLSLGGIAAIIATARLPGIHAVMVEAAFPDLQQDLAHAFQRYTGLPPFPLAFLTAWWGQIIVGTNLSEMRAIAAVDKIAPRPIFIIGDLLDNLVDEPRGSDALFARAGEPKQLWQLPNAKHVRAYQVGPEEYIDRLDAFFSDAL